MTAQSDTPKSLSASSDFYEELRLRAVLIASAAAQHIRNRRSELGLEQIAGSVELKSSSVDPVTIVDQESEALIRTLISEYRPSDEVYGEEQGEGTRRHGRTSAAGAPSESASDTPNMRVTWVVDPIDGTVNFLYGLPVYSVSIACRIGENVVAGAVADVYGNRIFSAAAHRGAYVSLADGRSLALQSSQPKDLSHSLVATGFSYSASRRATQGKVVAELLGQCRDIRRMGSAAMDLCFLAAGSIDAYYEHGLNEWDYAAGALIAREAGAVVITPGANGKSDEGRGVFAAAQTVADEFLETLEQLGAGPTHTFVE